MRYPPGHKEAMRERIVRAASRALRADGFAGVAIPALMKKVGLTHGGFYVHFENRDELVAEAVLSAAEDIAQGAFADDVSLEDTVARYVSMGHVAHPDQGCVIATLGTDGPRQAAVVRLAFDKIAAGLLGLTHKQLGGAAGQAPTDAALVHAATMVGAVVLARLLRDPVLAERLLAAARASIVR